MRNAVKGSTALFLSVALAAAWSFAVRAQEGETRTVLALYSQDQGAPFNQAFEAGLRRALQAAPGVRITYYAESLDGFSFPRSSFLAVERDYLRQKYADRQLDAIVAVGGGAANVILGAGSKLFSTKPVVTFAAVRSMAIHPEAASRTTGVSTGGSYRATLEMALRLHPSTRQVFVVLSVPGVDQSLAASVEEQLDGFGTVRVIYLRDVPTPALIDTLNRAPANSIVLYVQQGEDRRGQQVSPRDALADISSTVNLPFYGSHATYLGHGIVGGSMFDPDECGAIAGQMARRVVTGTLAHEIPPQEAPLSMRFDGRQLAKWGLQRAELPAGSIVVNREATLWSRWGYLLIALSIIVAQALLIAAFIVQRVRRIGAETRNKVILRTLPDLMFVLSGDGVFLDYHANDPRELRVAPEQFLGRHVREVMPPDLAERFMEQFEQARRSGAPCLMEYSLPVNGDDRVYEARISAYEGGKIMSIVRDITERQRADDALRDHDAALRLSDARARDLGGRLIAAQEAERARIARDLHDDLSQRLALLAIDVDRFTGGSTGDATSQADDIKGLVGEIASDVHRLAHELHPSKLQTIGLVAAIESCCRDISSRHGLDVQFRSVGVARFVKMETSLCLYRIVQESLQNVVRHSGATVAEVRLTGTKDYLELDVADPGRGFRAEDNHAGLGLISMRERVHHLGGRIVFHTHPGGGTRIGVRLPIHASRRVGIRRHIA